MERINREWLRAFLGVGTEWRVKCTEREAESKRYFEHVSATDTGYCSLQEERTAAGRRVQLVMMDGQLAAVEEEPIEQFALQIGERTFPLSTAIASFSLCELTVVLDCGMLNALATSDQVVVSWRTGVCAVACHPLQMAAQYLLPSE